MARILAFNGSPRKGGNTSTLIRNILDGARSEGADTQEVRLHEIDQKGCKGCLGCRTNPGTCAQKDGLSPFLEDIKNCDGLVVGCPIYMYRISGQMKLFIDRLYSLYADLPGGGYESLVPPGKTYALITTQGAPDPDQYKKSIRYLAGFTGSGLGFVEVGRIVHTNSHASPAEASPKLLACAYEIGRKLIKNNS
ncbi:MAG: flavodoxin family protein [Syntrophales bacterium]|jgi:multimeric flavodoxin WrbA|nr:flavodoxin family protein [Syntrophales bacterium]MDY0043047.1 flavodoxin family protein [Syntrophales bacterium]